MKRPRFRLPKLGLPSAATSIALLALAVSGIQLFFTVPVLTQFYFRPDLVVSGPPVLFKKSYVPKDASKPALYISYQVANQGNAAATKLEIGFIVGVHHRVAIYPAIAANVWQDEHGSVFKTVRVDVERLSPKEHFAIRFFPPSEPPPALGIDALVAGARPFFSFVRSAEGPGRFVPTAGPE